MTIAGIHPQPGGAWMEQPARNVTDPVDGCLRRARHLIHDRDPLYTRVFGEILESAGVQPIRLPPKSPNLNAYAERFVRSITEECLTRVVPLGEGPLRRLVYEYIEHDHRERHHQGLDNQLLQRPPPPRRPDADVRRRGTPRRIPQLLQSRGRMRGRPIKRTLRDPDFLFDRPRGSVGVRGGWLFERAGSDLFTFVQEQLTVEPNAFNAPTLAVDVGVGGKLLICPAIP